VDILDLQPFQLHTNGAPFAFKAVWIDERRREPMSCRIDRLSTERGLVLYISGRLAEEDLDVVRNALDGSRVVAIELAAVELVSRDAVKLLVQVEDRGIELRSCPAYIREWITNERESS
jgi:hypothetical protein